MLWQKILKQTEYALSQGALQPIPTTNHYLEQAGINFAVRISDTIERKKVSDIKQQQKKINPFLPHEEALFVDDLSETHFCLLNKFNVVDHHILIITKEFQEQDSVLTLEDLSALWICLSQVDGLGFFNGGKVAGASQKHKHLQLIPLPLSSLPLASIISATLNSGAITTSPALPFRHGIIHFDLEELTLESASLLLFNTYKTLYNHLGGGAYNLLVTRGWMLFVPRSQAEYLKISVNSLGFAGCFFVRNQKQFTELAEYGPLNLLKAVGVS